MCSKSFIYLASIIFLIGTFLIWSTRSNSDASIDALLSIKVEMDSSNIHFMIKKNNLIYSTYEVRWHRDQNIDISTFALSKLIYKDDENEIDSIKVLKEPKFGLAVFLNTTFVGDEIAIQGSIINTINSKADLIVDNKNFKIW